MANKPASTSVEKALDLSGFNQSKSNPSTYVNDVTKREVSVDGKYIKEKGGWINSDNKRKI